jgi:hypothetical protein
MPALVDGSDGGSELHIAVAACIGPGRCAPFGKQAHEELEKEGWGL